MNRYLERTGIARALKAATWKRRPGEAARADRPADPRHPAFSNPRAPIAGPTLTTGSTTIP